MKNYLTELKLTTFTKLDWKSWFSKMKGTKCEGSTECYSRNYGDKDNEKVTSGFNCNSVSTSQ